jgi:hypothetical protein
MCVEKDIYIRIKEGRKTEKSRGEKYKEERGGGKGRNRWKRIGQTEGNKE